MGRALLPVLLGTLVVSVLFLERLIPSPYGLAPGVARLFRRNQSVFLRMVASTDPQEDGTGLAPGIRRFPPLYRSDCGPLRSIDLSHVNPNQESRARW